mgnify:FL=1
MFEFSDPPVSNEFTGQSEVPVASLLTAGLENLLCVFGGLDDVFSFIDSEGEWFLTIDIFSCAHGGNRNQGVPVIDRSADDDVDILLSDEISKILKDFRSRVFLLSLSGADVINITDGDDLAKFSEESCTVASHPSATNEADIREVVEGFGGAG